MLRLIKIKYFHKACYPVFWFRAEFPSPPSPSVDIDFSARSLPKTKQTPEHSSQFRTWIVPNPDCAPDLTQRNPCSGIYRWCNQQGTDGQRENRPTDLLQNITDSVRGRFFYLLTQTIRKSLWYSSQLETFEFIQFKRFLAGLVQQSELEFQRHAGGRNNKNKANYSVVALQNFVVNSANWVLIYITNKNSRFAARFS